MPMIGISEIIRLAVVVRSMRLTCRLRAVHAGNKARGIAREKCDGAGDIVRRAGVTKRNTLLEFRDEFLVADYVLRPVAFRERGACGIDANTVLSVIETEGV
jgi:hypothetical protein